MDQQYGLAAPGATSRRPGALRADEELRAAGRAVETTSASADEEDRVRRAAHVEVHRARRLVRLQQRPAGGGGERPAGVGDQLDRSGARVGSALGGGASKGQVLVGRSGGQEREARARGG